jgi:hypothetical protein
MPVRYRSLQLLGKGDSQVNPEQMDGGHPLAALHYIKVTTGSIILFLVY